MPADRPTTGTGRRRQGATDPDRRDDRNRALERALDDETRALDETRSRKRQLGASGRDAAQREQAGTRED